MTEIDCSLIELENIEAKYDDLKARFEETMNECEDLNKKVLDYKVTVENLHEKL